MFKKIVSVIMIFTMLLAFASCGSKNEEKHTEQLVLPDKKVVIMVAPESQYPEDYKAAHKLAEQYPKNVVVREYADSRILVSGDPEIVTISEEVAADKSVGAIVYARATQFTYNAILKVNEINSDIYTLAIEPDQALNKVDEVADLIFAADWSKYSEDIVDTASKLGAEYFVFFSFDRHMANNPLYAQIKKYMADECDSKKIKFIYENSQDPNYAGGVEKAQFYIKQAIVNLYDNKTISGENVAVFSTDSSVQSTLVQQTIDRNLIYVSPSFPTPYNGINEVYDVTIPADLSDTESYIASVTSAVSKDTAGKGRFAVYNFTLASVLAKAAVYTAFDLLDGSADEKNLFDKATMRATDAADFKKFTCSKFLNAEKVLQCYAPGFVIIEAEKETTETEK